MCSYFALHDLGDAEHNPEMWVYMKNVHRLRKYTNLCTPSISYKIILRQ